MKDYLVKAVDYGQKLGADYIEVRTQRLFKTFLTTKDSRVEVAKEGTENGAGVRVLAKGAWGFVSLGKLDSKLLTEAVDEAFKLAKAASFRVKTPVKLVEAKVVEDRVVAKPRKDPREIPIEEKIDIALTMDKTILDYDRRMKSCTMD